MDIVNEKIDSTLTASFKDEDGNPITPSSGSYRIDDDSATEITGDTAFTPTGSSYDISISANENRILDATKSSEKRTVTVTFQYGGKQGVEEYRYLVRNLKYKT